MGEASGGEGGARVQALRIYIDESDRYRGRLLYEALLEMFKQEGLAGATVLRAISGFGGHRQIHHDSLVDVLPQLPIVVELIEQATTLERLRPKIEEMVTQGLVIVQEAEIWKYSYQRPLRELPPNATVGQVMSRKVTSVQPDTALAEVVQLLINQGYFKALPVVDRENRVIGIITDSDLVERGEVPLRLGLLETLNETQLANVMKRLQQDSRIASDVMTTRVTTVKKHELLRDVAHLMVSRHLKRLPVVDDEGRLVGMVGRLDVLKLIAQTSPPTTPHPDSHPQTSTAPAHTARDVMVKEVATVKPEMGIADLLDYLVASGLQRVVVVDGEDRVLGIITDADLVERVSPQAQPSVLRKLAQSFGFARPELALLSHEPSRTAHDVMSQPVVTAGPDDRLEEVVRLMVERGVKFLPIVDEQGRLLGAIRRAEVLQAISKHLADDV